MSVEQIEQTLLQLPPEERRRFAQWFYRHEVEIFDPQESDTVDPSVKAEILRRRDEPGGDPSLAIPVTDEWFDQLKRNLGDARPRQTPAR